jgi:hypothetical protein
MEAFLLGWAAGRWRPAGVKRVVRVKLVQRGRGSRSVTGVNHQVSKKTATAGSKHQTPLGRCPPPQPPPELSCLQVDPALLAGVTQAAFTSL